MHKFPPRSSATTVKHYILEKCLSAWGGIIINSNANVRLRFVDTCCGSGMYEPNAADPEASEDVPYETGSAVIGLKQLAELVAYGEQRGKQVQAKALLINKEVGELATLEQVIAEQVPNAPQYQTRLGRFADLTNDIVSFCSRSFAFVFVDPYGPTPVPFRTLAAVVVGKHTDVLINFPFLAFQKWTGFLDKSVQTRDQTTKLGAVDAFMDGVEWRDVVQTARGEGKPLEDALLGHYMEKLFALGVGVIAVPLLFEEKERVIYHLIFTSHNVAGLASAKEKFQLGQHHEDYLRSVRKVFRTRQPSLPYENNERDEDLDLGQIGELLHGQFAGRSATFKEVIRWGIFQPRVLEKHVQKAITALKKSGKVTYTDRNYRDLLTFEGR